jgi:hypothetical protein
MGKDTMAIVGAVWALGLGEGSFSLAVIPFSTTDDPARLTPQLNALDCGRTRSTTASKTLPFLYQFSFSQVNLFHTDEQR